MEKFYSDEISNLKTRILENGKIIVDVQEQCLNAINAQKAALNMIPDSARMSGAELAPADSIAYAHAHSQYLATGCDPSFSEQLSEFCDKQSDTLLKSMNG